MTDAMSLVGEEERLPRGRLQDLQKRFSQVIDDAAFVGVEFGCDYSSKALNSKPQTGQSTRKRDSAAQPRASYSPARVSRRLKDDDITGHRSSLADPVIPVQSLGDPIAKDESGYPVRGSHSGFPDDIRHQPQLYEGKKPFLRHRIHSDESEMSERNSKPPNNIVARQTCLFESSSSDISKMLDMVEQNNKGRIKNQPVLYDPNVRRPSGELWSPNKITSKDGPPKILLPKPGSGLTSAPVELSTTVKVPGSPKLFPKGITPSDLMNSKVTSSRASPKVAKKFPNAKKPAENPKPSSSNFTNGNHSGKSNVSLTGNVKPTTPASDLKPVLERMNSGQSESGSLIQEKKFLFQSKGETPSSPIKIMGLSFVAQSNIKDRSKLLANNASNQGPISTADKPQVGMPKSKLEKKFSTGVDTLSSTAQGVNSRKNSESKSGAPAQPVNVPPKPSSGTQTKISPPIMKKNLLNLNKMGNGAVGFSSNGARNALQLKPVKPSVRTTQTSRGHQSLTETEPTRVGEIEHSKPKPIVGAYSAVSKNQVTKDIIPSSRDFAEDSNGNGHTFVTGSPESQHILGDYLELRNATSGKISLGAGPAVDSSSDEAGYYSPPPPRKFPPRMPPAKPPRTFAHDRFILGNRSKAPIAGMAKQTHCYEDVDFNGGGVYASLRQTRDGPMVELPPKLPARSAAFLRPMATSYSAVNLTELDDNDTSWKSNGMSSLHIISSGDDDELDDRYRDDELIGKTSALKRIKAFLMPKQKLKSNNLKKYASAECISQSIREEEEAERREEERARQSKGSTLTQTGKYAKNKKPWNKPEKTNFGISKLVFSRKGAAEPAKPKSIADLAYHRAIVDEREKIFSKLRGVFTVLQAVSALSPADEEAVSVEEDRPDPVTLEKRLKHCASVKNYSNYSTLEKLREYASRAYPQLYQYALTVSIRKNPDTNIYEPYVKFKFPPKVEPEKTAIPLFCFPDAETWHRVQEYKSESYSFVLTDVDGSRQYGFCRRVLPKGHRDAPKIPDVFCIVSPLNAFKFFEEVLNEVEKRSGTLDDAEEFLKAAYGRPLPNPGKTVTVRAIDDVGELGSVSITRSPENQREGLSYNCLLQFLSIGKILKIFGAIMLERNVIFCADKLSNLSQCVHSFISLLYPFSWEHTLIPLLPAALMEVVCAPTPFIVGLLSCHKDKLSEMEREKALIVNLDTNKFLEKESDEEDILPKKVVRALTAALNMAKNDDKLSSEIIMESFLRFFIEMIGNYNKFLVKEVNGNRVFQKEEFICAAESPSVGAFLEWFTETQMFSVYINEKLESITQTNGVFERRIEMWNQEKSNPKVKRGKRLFKIKEKKR